VNEHGPDEGEQFPSSSIRKQRASAEFNYEVKVSRTAGLGQEQVAFFPVPNLASQGRTGNSQMEIANMNTILGASS
jgi:hypothetical protein